MLCRCNAHDIFSTMFISDASSKVPSTPFGSAFCWPKLAWCSLRSFWSSFRLASTLVSVLSHVGRWMYLLACTSHHTTHHHVCMEICRQKYHEGPCEPSLQLSMNCMRDTCALHHGLEVRVAECPIVKSAEHALACSEILITA